MKKIITLCIVLLMSANSMFAATWLVEKTAGQWTNTSAATLGTATLVDGDLGAWFATTPAVGDQVWIIGNTTFTLATPIAPKDGMSIYGGFAGTEATITARATGAKAWIFTAPTTLDGNNAVVVIDGIVNTLPTTIGGVTITKGLANGGNAGGGATIKDNTILQNCIITACANTGASGQTAGGIFMTGGAQLLNSYVNANTSTFGGGGINVAGSGTIDGCTIDNNECAGNGGGIYLNQGSGAGPVVNNCIVTNNKANGIVASSGNGGGIMVFMGTNTVLSTPAMITNCTITNNASKSAGNGGGLYINDSNVTLPLNIYNISNCNISNNTSVANGAGFFYKASGTVTFNTCTFDGNSTTNSVGGGASIAGTDGTVTFNRTTFKNNSSGTTTGGAINANPAGFTANNCLFIKNTGNSVIQFQSTTGTAQYYTLNNCTVALNFKSDGTTAAGCNVNSTASCVITNSLFLGCGNNPLFVTTGKAQPIATYCGFESTANITNYINGTGCIKTIEAASFTDAANGDFHLSSGSTAINAGTTIAGITSDIEGTLRPQGAAFDMGAYEYSVGTNLHNAYNESSLVFQNRIAKTVQVNASAGSTLMIVNMLGEVVKSEMINSNNMTFSTANIPSGVYVVQLINQGKKNAQKIIF